MIHITNGDSVAATLALFCKNDVILPWRDVLHEGPVPSGLSFEELSAIRCRFLAEMGWGGDEQLRTQFAARDEQLASFRNHAEVVLWFEHDLYDQLQLIQILAWLAGEDRGSTRISLINIGSHPEVPRFLGLGQLTAAQLEGLLPSRKEVERPQYDLARMAWGAFRSPDPRRLEDLAKGQPNPLLHFLPAALHRHLEQFPSTRNGLSRTEHTALEVLCEIQPTPAPVLFATANQREEAPFLGDATFYWYLANLSADPNALVRLQSGKPFRAPLFHRGEQVLTENLVITKLGRTILAGARDSWRLRAQERWLGGVHLSGPDPAWRWDSEHRRLVGRPRNPGAGRRQSSRPGRTRR